MVDLLFLCILGGGLYVTWYFWPLSGWAFAAWGIYILVSEEIKWWLRERPKARSAEERRRWYFAHWATHLAMIETACRLDGTRPLPAGKGFGREYIRVILVFAFWVTLITVAVAQSVGADADERNDSGYNDGFAAGYNTTCEIRATLIEGDWDDSEYSSGYEAGYADGAKECEQSRR